MRRTKVLVLPVVILILAFGAWATVGASAEESSRSNQSLPVVVGALLPFTGSEADVASEEKNAMELALNESGRDRLKVIYKDSAGLSSRAEHGFKELVDEEKASVVVTCASWITNSVAPLAADRDVLLLGIASASFNRTEGVKAEIFTVGIDEEAERLAGYLQSYERIALIYMDNDFGRGWAEKLESRFEDKVVAQQSYALDQTGYASQIAEIKAASPDVLVMISYKEGAEIAREAREQGIEAQLVSTRPIERPAILKEPAVEGLVYTYPSFNTTGPFFAGYTALYGQEPTAFGAEAYDAVISLTQAAGECDGQVGCTYRWYQGREYRGALGEVSFDAEGDASYPVILKEVGGGKFEDVN